MASRCVLKKTEIDPGMDVIVSGCGIIGMLCAFLARASGADVTVTGVEADAEVRLKKARSLGFETVVVAEGETLSGQIEEPADRLIEASGAPSAIALAGDSVKWGGLISIIATYGTNIDWPATKVVRGEQRVTGTMASAWDDFQHAMRHLLDGLVPVKELVEIYPLEGAVDAFDASIERRTPKAVMIP